ncbi:hypothetical protein IGI04_035116 [Brassica rapa subsp. trilocularis]|uniref:CCHC-type domain-containing protein n=1 Tax=Brassica rapa subsp. trilocularis TaxID=1813537 RepID=A0ABQ7LEI0_BRACM|nr:hypothetical protein IGI04_035116 [Brassica rapa subsp. trilocularis]
MARITHLPLVTRSSRFHLGSEEQKAVGVDLLPFANIRTRSEEPMMTPPRYGKHDSAIAQGNNHCYEHEHESTGRNPTDSHIGYEQEERYEDLRERNQAPDMYGSRRNYATTHNPRRNECEFMHRERTSEPRCRQEQRTAVSSYPLIVLVQGLLDRLDHRTDESSERRPSYPPDYLKMVTLMKKFGTVRYPGRTDPFEASTWLRNLEKNFWAIHCPDNFKKDDNLIEGEVEEEGLTNGLRMAQICPYSQGIKAPDYITCFSCGEKGHYANRTLCVGGVYVHVLFDSGATHSFVVPEIVSSFKGTFTRVKVARHVLLLYWIIHQAALAYVLLVELVAGHKTCFNWTDLWLHTNLSPIGGMGTHDSSCL